MSLKLTIDQVLAKAFDSDAALKRINRTAHEIDQLRDLVEHEKWIPHCVTDKHVSFGKRSMKATAK